jgi:hypothetical protein
MVEFGYSERNNVDLADGDKREQWARTGLLDSVT